MKLDPELFAEGPKRDARFDVREQWDELVNLPLEHKDAAREFLHRQMNEEVNGMEMAARGVADFPEAPWELRMEMARQAWDEARHVVAFRRSLEARGGFVGEFPVMNFQYRIITKIPSLLGRLAVQNRSFEAAGMDAIQQEIEGHGFARNDPEMQELFDAQLADELQHVRFANVWIEKLRAATGPSALMELARATSAAGRALEQIAGGGLLAYPVNAPLRREAGFGEEEISAARASAARLGSAG